MRKHLRKSPLLRHASHAEWGHGILYEENRAKIYLCFEDGRRRAFVNAPQYREQLVPADLPVRVAALLRARLEGLLPEGAVEGSRRRKAARVRDGARVPRRASTG